MGVFDNRSGGIPVASERRELVVAGDVVGSVDLTCLDDGLKASVRAVLSGILDGGSLDSACATCGMTEGAFLVLCVANDSVMDALMSATRVLGVSSAVKVGVLARSCESSLGNTQGMRLAMQGHMWLATNAVPELLNRASASKERGKHLKKKEEAAGKAQSDASYVNTGVRERDD